MAHHHQVQKNNYFEKKKKTAFTQSIRTIIDNHYIERHKKCGSEEKHKRQNHCRRRGWLRWENHDPNIHCTAFFISHLRTDLIRFNIFTHSLVCVPTSFSHNLRLVHVIIFLFFLRMCVNRSFWWIHALQKKKSAAKRDVIFKRNEKRQNERITWLEKMMWHRN